MANLDWSWVSLGVDENDLMFVDPIAVAASLKRVINQLTHGEVATAAHRFGLNIRSDAMILRNRVERHEMRRHFGADAASFIADLTNCKETYKLTLDEIVKALPSVLDGESRQWCRREYQFWKTYGDFVDAFRIQYSFENAQERLRKELQVHPHGPSEEISTYLLKVRDLLDQVKPPLTLGEQLDRFYQKLNPSHRLRIERKDFENFPELQMLGKRKELRRAQEKAYKPPPPISDSAFPASAYIPPKQQRHVRLAPVV